MELSVQQKVQRLLSSTFHPKCTLQNPRTKYNQFLHFINWIHSNVSSALRIQNVKSKFALRFMKVAKESACPVNDIAQWLLDNTTGSILWSFISRIFSLARVAPTWKFLQIDKMLHANFTRLAVRNFSRYRSKLFLSLVERCGTPCEQPRKTTEGKHHGTRTDKTGAIVSLPTWMLILNTNTRNKAACPGLPPISWLHCFHPTLLRLHGNFSSPTRDFHGASPPKRQFTMSSFGVQTLDTSLSCILSWLQLAQVVLKAGSEGSPSAAVTFLMLLVGRFAQS